MFDVWDMWVMTLRNVAVGYWCGAGHGCLYLHGEVHDARSVPRCRWRKGQRYMWTNRKMGEVWPWKCHWITEKRFVRYSHRKSEVISCPKTGRLWGSWPSNKLPLFPVPSNSISMGRLHTPWFTPSIQPSHKLPSPWWLTALFLWSILHFFPSQPVTLPWACFTHFPTGLHVPLSLIFLASTSRSTSQHHTLQPEHGGSKILWNVGIQPQYCTVSQTRRPRLVYIFKHYILTIRFNIILSFMTMSTMWHFHLIVR